MPIALAIAGCAVALLTRTHGNFERACDAYAVRLERKNVSLGDEDTIDGTNLNAGILLSLEYLEVEYLKWKTKYSLGFDESVSELYTRLCVLENQAWVPVSVLSRLWQMDEDSAIDIANLFNGMCLATLKIRKPSNGCAEQTGIILHDLHLDFCRRQARKSRKDAQWHAQLLKGYLAPSTKQISSTSSPNLTQTIISWKPRPWWSDAVPQDGYIHANLARHLSLSGQGEELAALLLDSRWTGLRAKIGGILALEEDFELLDAVFSKWLCAKQHDSRLFEVRRAFRQIFKALLPSWGTLMMEGRRSFQFRLCGLLRSLRQVDVVVDVYLKSVESCTPKPFLLPVSTFFPELASAPKIEVPIGGDCECIDCSPCGNYVTAGTKNEIVVAEIRTGETLQRLRGHTQVVWSVHFVQGSKKIVSGSRDGTVMVWDWQSSHSPVRVLEGHPQDVISVAVSGDSEKIFSSSANGIVVVWDLVTGLEVGRISQTDRVACIALSADEQKIAIGFYTGTLKVLDICSKEVLFEDNKAHDGYIGCLCASPNGQYLVTGSADWSVRLWDAEKWSRIGDRLDGHFENVTDVAFSPDSKKFASTSWDGTVRLWDVESRKCVGITPAIIDMVTCVAFTSGSGRCCGSSEGVIRVWDELPGTLLAKSSCGHSGSVLGVSISQDGERVATASTDQTVRLWDLKTGEQFGYSMYGHGDRVTCVSFSPDGRQVVSGSDDCSLRLWDTETNFQKGHPFIGHISGVKCASFSGDGIRIVSGSSDSTVRVWSAHTHEQLGDAMEGHALTVTGISETADGCYIVSREEWLEYTIIWHRSSKSIVWTSREYIFMKTPEPKTPIGMDEAEKIIRSCGQECPRIWPRNFEGYTAGVYWENRSLYSDCLGEKTALAKLVPYADWKYNSERKNFCCRSWKRTCSSMQTDSLSKRKTLYNKQLILFVRSFI